MCETNGEARWHEGEVGEGDELSLRASLELYKFLHKGFSKPKVDLLDKKMKGIYKREMWYWVNTIYLWRGGD